MILCRCSSHHFYGGPESTIGEVHLMLFPAVFNIASTRCHVIVQTNPYTCRHLTYLLTYKNKIAATLWWFTAALRQLLQNRKWRHWWRHNLGSRWKLHKMARENFSIGALYSITKNQDNPIKTVGRDSFLSPKTPKNKSFLGSPSPRGRTAPIF